jgi:hypothetical protein
VHYWLSRKGEGTTGPYAEEQLRGMWANGLVIGDDHICATGQFHDWMSLSILMDAFEEQKNNDAVQRKNADLMLALASRKYDRQKKSLAIAIAMSVFLPMVGQCDTQEWKQVIMGWLICLTVFGIPLIWIASLCDCPAAVIRHNQKLADRIGL